MAEAWPVSRPAQSRERGGSPPAGSGRTRDPWCCLRRDTRAPKRKPVLREHLGEKAVAHSACSVILYPCTVPGS